MHSRISRMVSIECLVSQIFLYAFRDTRPSYSFHLWNRHYYRLEIKPEPIACTPIWLIFLLRFERKVINYFTHGPSARGEESLLTNVHNRSYKAYDRTTEWLLEAINIKENLHNVN